MTQTDDFLIGQTKINAGFSSKKWFYLMPGNNLFRVLPPLHSLAATGQVAKYWASHRCFRDTKGKQRTVCCIQEKNKDKLITVHCPICDLYEDRKLQYEELKKSGQYNDETMKKWAYQHCFPFQREMRYFINAINIEGEIGILALPVTAWESFKHLLTAQFEHNYDPTGINGAFINFQKIQKFKGDRDTSYQASLAVEQGSDSNGQLVQRIKMHTLTDQIIARLKTETVDLSSLFTRLEADKLATLLQLSGEDQAKQVEAFMSPPQDHTPNDPSLVSIPNTEAKAVVTPVITPSGQFLASSIGDTRNQTPYVSASTSAATIPSATMPTAAAPAAPAAPAAAPAAPAAAPAAPAAAPAAPTPTPPSATMPPVPNAPAGSIPLTRPAFDMGQTQGGSAHVEMTDEDFIKTFQPQ